MILRDLHKSAIDANRVVKACRVVLRERCLLLLVWRIVRSRGSTAAILDRASAALAAMFLSSFKKPSKMIGQLRKDSAVIGAITHNQSLETSAGNCLIEDRIYHFGRILSAFSDHLRSFLHFSASLDFVDFDNTMHFFSPCSSGPRFCAAILHIRAYLMQTTETTSKRHYLQI